MIDIEHQLARYISLNKVKLDIEKDQLIVKDINSDQNKVGIFDKRFVNLHNQLSELLVPMFLIEEKYKTEIMKGIHCKGV